MNLPYESHIKIKNANTMFYIAITLWVLAGISFLMFLCYFRTIRLAIAIIKSAALFLADVPSALFVPLVFGVLVMVFWAFWIMMFMYVYSCGNI